MSYEPGKSSRCSALEPKRSGRQTLGLGSGLDKALDGNKMQSRIDQMSPSGHRIAQQAHQGPQLHSHSNHRSRDRGGAAELRSRCQLCHSVCQTHNLEAQPVFRPTLPGPETRLAEPISNLLLLPEKLA